MRHRKLLYGRRRGAVLALVVIIMLLLSISGLTAVQLSQAARVRTIESDASISARYAADAGVERTLYLMNRGLADGQWSPSETPGFSDEPLAGSDAVYSVTVAGSVMTGYTLTSAGKAGDTTRTVRVGLRLASPFSMNFAIFSENNITLKNNSSVKGFDSSDPSLTNLTADIGTMSDNKGSIDIKDGAEVFGDIYVGPNGDPLTVVALKDPSDVTGEIFNHPFPPPFPSVSAPEDLSTKGTLKGDSFTLDTTDSGIYSSIEISNGGQLIIEGDCVLVVTGKVELKNNAEINITSDGSLTLYVEGDVDAKNAAGVVNETAVPSNFKLYGTGESQSISLKNSTDFYGVVYAPHADMTLNNGGNAFGSFIVNNFDLKNSGNVYYDKALKEPETIEEAARFVIVSWEEL